MVYTLLTFVQQQNSGVSLIDIADKRAKFVL